MNKRLAALGVFCGLALGALWGGTRVLREWSAEPAARELERLAENHVAVAATARGPASERYRAESSAFSEQEEAGEETIQIPHGDASSMDSGARAARVFGNLRSAIEASTYESMDPRAILDAAEYVLEMELADRAIPEIADFGEIVVPFLDAPEGISAELTISRSRSYGNVLGLRVVMAAPNGPYYLDGTFRDEAECTIRAYNDPASGRLASLGIMTNLEPAPSPESSWAYLANASFTQGLLYNFDARDPATASTMSACGYEGGRLADWQVPISLDSPMPPVQEVERLVKRMQTLYDNLKKPRRMK